MLPGFKSLGSEKHTSSFIVLSTPIFEWRAERGMLKCSHSSEHPILHWAELQQVLQMTLYINVQCSHLSKQQGHMGEKWVCSVLVWTPWHVCWHPLLPPCILGFANMLHSFLPIMNVSVFTYIISMVIATVKVSQQFKHVCSNDTFEMRRILLFY